MELSNPNTIEKLKGRGASVHPNLDGGNPENPLECPDRTAGCCVSLNHLMRREFLTYYRNPTYLLTFLLIQVLLSTMCAGLYSSKGRNSHIKWKYDEVWRKWEDIGAIKGKPYKEVLSAPSDEGKLDEF